MNISIKKLDQNAILPQRMTEYSAGYDLFANNSEPLCLKKGERMRISTGVAVALPEGFEAQIRPRSGLAFKHGVTVLNSPGTIDSDYRGEICVILINHGESEFVIEPGMRIAQMVIARCAQATMIEVETLDDTARGAGGFGSTGR